MGESCDIEMAALQHNNTWEVVFLHHEENIVGCKWVLSVKFQADGSIELYKALLVVKSFTQISDKEYSATFP